MANTGYDITAMTALGDANLTDDGTGIDELFFASLTLLAATDINLAWTSASGVATSASAFYTSDAGPSFRLVVDGQIENVRGSNSADLISGNELANTLFGDGLSTGPGGRDSISGAAGNDSIYGGSGADLLGGDAGRDMLWGGAGADTISGGTGADNLLGGAGADSLSGGAGGDVLTGGVGADLLVGNAGADRFVITAVGDSTVALSGRDIVFDFLRADGDKIDLRAIDAVAGGTNDAFILIGTGAFSGAAGEVRVLAAINGFLVQGTVDAGTSPDFSFLLRNVAVIGAGDFLL